MDDQAIVYEAGWLIELISSECGKTNVVNYHLLEERIIKHIGNYLTKNPSRIKNKRFLRKMAMEKVVTWKELYGNSESMLMDDLNIDQNEDDDEDLTYEPEDLEVDIENDLILKETVALLTQGNRRKEIIVEAWLNGIYNTSKISRMITELLGGKDSSHRIFIQRFTKECLTKMTAIS